MESKPQFNKDQMTPEELSAWVEKKQDQRETVNALADRQLVDVFSDPQELNAHLKRQATFGKMGVTNVLLIGAQNVEATDVRTFEEWKERGRSIGKGEKITLDFDGENQRVITISDLNNSGRTEEGKKLSMEIASGVLRIFQRISAAMPDEVNQLMTLMTLVQ